MIKNILLLIFVSIFFVSCSNTKNVDNKITNKTTQDTNKTQETKSNKRTYIRFASTQCPHCREEMPVLEEFYKKYKNKVNMQVIVINKEKFPWNYTIPQDITNPITYEQITWDTCQYVPSYVIYDENKKIIEKGCWKKLTFEELEQKLLITNKNNMSKQTEWFKEWDLWVILTTTNWKIEIKIFDKEVPKTALNFMVLAQDWYYNNTIFHRVINNFMIQWWDPEGTWMWGTSIYWEKFEDEFSKDLKNIRWAVSMANSWPNTNGSQFFINQKDNPYLDYKHSVFGQVVNWLDVVDKIAKSKTDSNDRPEKEIKIIKAEVVKYEKWVLKPYKIDKKAELEKIKKQEQEKQEANKNRQVKAWDKIKVNYTLTLKENGEKFDSSLDRWTPFEFEVWAWQVIPWFDKWVIGMKIWEKKKLEIPPKEWYWEYSPENIQEVPKSELQGFVDAWYKLEVWVKLPTMYWELEIKEVKDDTVKIDLNHPLAWKDLIFDVELIWFEN